MKYLYSIILLITFIGCSMNSNYYIDPYFDFIDNIESVNKTPIGLTDWVNNNIIYESDLVDYWQSPQETLDRGAGDCEDMAILSYFLIKDYTDYEVSVVMSMDHAIIKMIDYLGYPECYIDPGNKCMMNKYDYISEYRF